MKRIAILFILGLLLGLFLSGCDTVTRETCAKYCRDNRFSHAIWRSERNDYSWLRIESCGCAESLDRFSDERPDR